VGLLGVRQYKIMEMTMDQKWAKLMDRVVKIRK
jgi:hypothetical protein